MMLVTDFGATGSRKSRSAPYAPIRSRNAIKKIIAGKNASRELYATCCESPMQSSATNSLPLDLKTASQSRTLRRLTPLWSAAPTDQAHRRADSAGDNEP